MNYFNFILKLIIIIAALVCAILIIKKDSLYLGNRLMAVAMVLFLFYTLGIFLYDLIESEWAVQLFLRSSMISAILGANLIYFSMQCLVNSSHWFNQKRNWIPHFFIVFIYSIYIISIDFITFSLLPDGGVNVQISLLPTAIMGIGMLFYLGSSLYFVNKYGIKKTSGIQQQKMKIFSMGIILGILSIFMSIFSQLPFFTDATGSLFDILFFMILAFSLMVLTLGFIKKGKNDTKESRENN
ncbi:hypothetical protein [Candidatus Lokiarchaeum ossiferum]|uniref:hypothetical protein n=1 Tax=Candidatus Lokiarchaeum ossiferum TaxID=2951803 RepID=UPI00352BEA28